jgi:hypothetical protein
MQTRFAVPTPTAKLVGQPPASLHDLSGAAESFQQRLEDLASAAAGVVGAEGVDESDGVLLDGDTPGLHTEL